MNLVKCTDQIEYLVKRKFPGSNAPPPLTSLSSRSSGTNYNYENYQKRLDDIKAYKKELFNKTPAEVKALYDTENNKEVEAIKLKLKLEEQSRFFNLPYANADFVHWSKAAHWSLDEALALSFGKSPDIVSWDKVKPFTNISEFAKEYAKRRDLALRALPWKKLYDPMLPTIFISWAKELDIELPANLISNVEKKLGIAVNWFEEYQKIKIAYDDMKNKNVPASDKNKYPLELDYAIKAWQAVSSADSKKKPKAQIKAWLDANAKELSNEAKERISIVSNWDKLGGATRTD